MRPNSTDLEGYYIMQYTVPTSGAKVYTVVGCLELRFLYTRKIVQYCVPLLARREIFIAILVIVTYSSIQSEQYGWYVLGGGETQIRVPGTSTTSSTQEQIDRRIQH